MGAATYLLSCICGRTPLRRTRSRYLPMKLAREILSTCETHVSTVLPLIHSTTLTWIPPARPLPALVSGFQEQQATEPSQCMYGSGSIDTLGAHSPRLTSLLGLLITHSPISTIFGRTRSRSAARTSLVRASRTNEYTVDEKSCTIDTASCKTTGSTPPTRRESSRLSSGRLWKRGN
jgi:hypothetical protein